MGDFDHIVLTTAHAGTPRQIPPPRGPKQKPPRAVRSEHAESLRQQTRELFGNKARLERDVPLVLELQPGYSSRAKTLRGVLEGLGLEFGRIDDRQTLTVWTTPSTGEHLEERLERFARSKRKEGPTFNPIKSLRRKNEEIISTPLRQRLTNTTAAVPVLLELDGSTPSSVTSQFFNAVRRDDPAAHSYEAEGVRFAEARLTSSQIYSLLKAYPAISKVDIQTDFTPGLPGREAALVPPRPPLTLVPPVHSPTVCVVDTGVDPDHPYLQGVVVEADHASYLADATDRIGHGTFTTGVVAYADSLKQQICDGVLQPDCRVISMKAFGTGEAGQDQILTAVREALEKYRHRTPVFNLSLQSNCPYLMRTGHPNIPSSLAAELDRLARRYDALFVVSAGNVSARQLENVDEAFPLSHRAPLFAICSPAEGINVLSVGACNGVIEHPDLLGEPGGPSPCSPVGPGIGGMRKPEVIAPGGGYVSISETIDVVPETSVFSLRPSSLGTTTGYDVGTSWAAAFISRLAAMLHHRYPHATANLLRALIVHSTDPVGPTLAFPDADEIWQSLTGFGRPNQNCAVASGTSRVCYLFQGTLEAGKQQDIQFFVPASFLHSPRPALKCTLVYDPPVYPGSADYYSKLQLSYSIHAPRSPERCESIPPLNPVPDDAHTVKLRRFTVPGWCRADMLWSARVSCRQYTGIALAPEERRQRFALVIELQDMTGQFPLYHDCQARYLRKAA